MEIFGLFGLFGVLELIALAVFVLLLIAGCIMDRRRDQEAFKWWVAAIGIIFAIWHFWPAFKPAEGTTLSGMMMNSVGTFAFWAPFLAYIAIGLVYCIPEFVMDVRRAAKFYAREWEIFKNKTVAIDVYAEDGNRLPAPILGKKSSEQENITVAALVQRARDYKNLQKNNPDDPFVSSAKFREVTHEAHNQIGRFRDQYQFKNRIVQIGRSDDDQLSVEPSINKVELAEHIGAWTIFWPFYAVALVLGDVLAELWNQCAEFISTFAGRWVRRTFSDVFKLG